VGLVVHHQHAVEVIQRVTASLRKHLRQCLQHFRGSGLINLAEPFHKPRFVHRADLIERDLACLSLKREPGSGCKIKQIAQGLHGIGGRTPSAMKEKWRWDECELDRRDVSPACRPRRLWSRIGLLSCRRRSGVDPQAKCGHLRVNASPLMTFTAVLPADIALPEETWLHARVRKHGRELEITAERNRGQGAKSNK
jgi:hypothetical protein